MENGLLMLKNHDHHRVETEEAGNDIEEISGCDTGGCDQRGQGWTGEIESVLSAWWYQEELQEVLNAQTKNSNFIKAAMHLRRIDFSKDVIQKLENCKFRNLLTSHIERLKRLGFVAHDDYSIALM